MNARKTKVIDSLADELHRRRVELLGDMDETQGDLKTMAQEREPELEEDAQKGRIATVLERLSERDKQMLDEIDAALQRIADGTYGKCAACGKPIALARLRALPTTRLCIDCARARESKAGGGAGEDLDGTRLPADLSLLEDPEIEAVLRDLVRDAGGIDTEELEITSRDGVVYLRGALPSEKQHQVVTDLLHDVGGLGEVVDRLQIEPIAWQRSDRSKPESAAEHPDTGTPEDTEDVTDEFQGNRTYSPPLRPPPKAEASSSRRGMRRN
ncbi:MAG: TraR/DksA C4-type zinc finger protein [Candidatus Binatia bacterium]